VTNSPSQPRQRPRRCREPSRRRRSRPPVDSGRIATPSDIGQCPYQRQASLDHRAPDSDPETWRWRGEGGSKWLERPCQSVGPSPSGYSDGNLTRCQALRVRRPKARRRFGLEVAHPVKKGDLWSSRHGADPADQVWPSSKENNRELIPSGRLAKIRTRNPARRRPRQDIGRYVEGR
jgi:hypothetical protein